MKQPAIILFFIFSIVLIHSEDNYILNLKNDTFSIMIESQGSEIPVKTTLFINKDGKVDYVRSGYSYAGEYYPPKSRAGKIAEKDILELFDFIINKNGFFLLPSDMSTKLEIMDSSTEYITVEYNGKSHKIGGYHPYSNSFYNAISKLINKLTDSVRK